MAKVIIKIDIEGAVNLDAQGFQGNACERSEKLAKIIELIEQDGEVDEVLLKYKEAAKNIQSQINTIEF